MEQGHIETAEYLLKAGEKQLPCGSGAHPLHVVAWCPSDRSDIAGLLLSSGADINMIYKNISMKQSPLGLALSQGNLGIVRCFVNKGCSLANAFDGRSALEYACTNDSIDTTALDILWLAKEEKRSSSTCAPINLGSILISTCRRSCQPNFPDERGDITAAKIAWLLEYNAPGNYQDVHGLSAMHIVAELNDTQLASVLLRWGSAVDLVSTYGCTPLHVAAMHESVGMMQLLLENHARKLRRQTSLPHVITCYDKDWDGQHVSRESRQAMTSLFCEYGIETCIASM